MRIILTGGGSGGHVSPALAVAKHLQQKLPQSQLLYIGGTMAMEGSTGPSVEQSMVNQTDIPFVAIPVGKLKRDGLSWRTLTRLWGVIPGTWSAWRQIGQFKPDIVFSSGGYVSVPVVLSAWLRRVPVVIHEQTAAVGLANRLASRLATAIAITFPQSAVYFPKSKVSLTGNPLGQHLTTANPTSISQTEVGQWLQNTSQLPLLYITGGGQGSHAINMAIIDLLPQLLDNWRIVHQTGANQKFADYQRLITASKQWLKQHQDHYYPVEHLSGPEVGVIYSQSQLVVGRAGANTVLEVAYWGLPAVFIPIPWVTHDEQTKNAATLVEAGTAVILPESQLKPSTLLAAINQQAKLWPVDPQVKQKAQNLIQEGAADKIVDLLLTHGHSSITKKRRMGP